MTSSPVPEGRIVNLAGRGETFARVALAHTGATTVLLSHGWLASADLNWYSVYEALGTRMNVVAIDHRGHGRGIRSSRPFDLSAAADDAAALLDVLGTGPVVAVGYSMGGPIVLELAKRHPTLVDGLVLSATAMSFANGLRSRARWAGLGAIGVGLRFDADAWAFTRLIDRAAQTDATTALWRDQLLGDIQRGTTAAALEAGRALRSFDASGYVAGLEIPATSLITVRDRIVAPRHQRALAEAIAAQVIEVEADHDVFVTNGPMYAAALVTAVEGVALRAGGGHAHRSRPRAERLSRLNRFTRRRPSRQN